MCYISDNSIAEENDEGEEYDDVDEDLKAQILSRNEVEQEKESAVEEGSKNGPLIVCVVLARDCIFYMFLKVHHKRMVVSMS